MRAAVFHGAGDIRIENVPSSCSVLSSSEACPYVSINTDNIALADRLGKVLRDLNLNFDLEIHEIFSEVPAQHMRSSQKQQTTG